MGGNPRRDSRAVYLRDEAQRVADSFEKGEPYYTAGFHFEPTGDETPDDAYWRGLYEIAQRAAPEIVSMLFDRKLISAPQRAQLLIALWDKVHDKLYEQPEQVHSIKVPLPEATETPEEWQDRIGNNSKLLTSPPPTPDPRQNS